MLHETPRGELVLVEELGSEWSVLNAECFFPSAQLPSVFRPPPLPSPEENPQDNNTESNHNNNNNHSENSSSDSSTKDNNENTSSSSSAENSSEVMEVGAANIHSEDSSTSDNTNTHNTEPTPVINASSVIPFLTQDHFESCFLTNPSLSTSSALSSVIPPSHSSTPQPPYSSASFTAVAVDRPVRVVLIRAGEIQRHYRALLFERSSLTERKTQNNNNEDNTSNNNSNNSVFENDATDNLNNNNDQVSSSVVEETNETQHTQLLEENNASNNNNNNNNESNNENNLSDDETLHSPEPAVESEESNNQ